MISASRGQTFMHPNENLAQNNNYDVFLINTVWYTNLSQEFNENNLFMIEIMFAYMT